MRIAPQVPFHKSLFPDELDAPVDAWSLDELYKLADLDSVRLACGRTDYAEAWRES